MDKICLRCNKINPTNCSKNFCPIIEKPSEFYKPHEMKKANFESSSPAPFVGRYGYPNINVGILTPPDTNEQINLYDNPRYWATHNYNIPQIMDFRFELINSRQKHYIKANNKILDIAQEVGMASKAVDVEVNLVDKPKFKLNTDSHAAPRGPNAQLKKAIITSNTKIDYKVDKVVADTDLKSKDGLIYLYNSGFDENFLSKLLSVGTMGIKNNRKLVPTRWSITASDDTIGKELIKEIKDYKEADFQIYFGDYLGNYYLILLFPDVWRYELFESYMPNEKWNIKEVNYTTDYESYSGRKQYAFETTGGYYTVRLAIAEFLKNIKRQASCLAIRVITPEYTNPLGVWVTREATRITMNSSPINFDSRTLMLNYAKDFIKRKFGFSIDHILKNSKLLKELTQQKKLTNYLK